jgi:hypothetical protein
LDRPESYRDKWDDDHDLLAQAYNDFKEYIWPDLINRLPQTTYYLASTAE